MKTTREISDITINLYCFYSDKDPESDLSIEERRAIVEERIKHLDNTEWQRWVPFVGLYRTLHDSVNDDSRLLNNIHSPRYNGINIIYNVATATAILGGVLNSLLK